MMQNDVIQNGMPVFGSDAQTVGTVVEVHGDPAVGTVEIDCGGQFCRVPLTAVAQVTADGVYLPNPADQYLSQPHARAVRAAQPDSAEAVPLPPMIDPHDDAFARDVSQ